MSWVKEKLLFLVAIILLLASFLFYFFFIPSKKIAYVDNLKLFEGFVMTKEVKKNGDKEVSARQLSLDKLYQAVQSPTLSPIQKKLLMEQFISSREDLEKFKLGYGAQQSAKIWSRIKSYSVGFAQEGDYDLIFGSEGGQTVLYADDKIDVTNLLLTFINKKYEGK